MERLTEFADMRTDNGSHTGQKSSKEKSCVTKKLMHRRRNDKSKPDGLSELVNIFLRQIARKRRDLTPENKSQNFRFKNFYDVTILGSTSSALYHVLLCA